ncbi:MAG TPA: TlpA disulfide reductase family protein [Chthonomonadaceae bacterium]|nr:TlpA disulfide reductase family protein [Chthonomonadaceae bacterium]
MSPRPTSERQTPTSGTLARPTPPRPTVRLAGCTGSAQGDDPVATGTLPAAPVSMHSHATPAAPWIGASAPQFDLPDVDGKRVRLEEMRGKPVLLNFWAFWCDTWRAEMPDLREIAARQEEIGFCIVTISVDGTRLPEFAPRAAPPFPVLLDIGGATTQAYQVGHVPTVILLDGAGRIRYSAVAWPGSQAVLNQLRELVSAGPAPDRENSGQGGRTATGAARASRPPARGAVPWNASKLTAAEIRQVSGRERRGRRTKGSRRPHGSPRRREHTAPDPSRCG